MNTTLQRVLVIPLVLLVLALAGVIYWSSHRASEAAAHEFSQKILLDMVERVRQTTDAHLVGARVAIDALAPDPIYSPVEDSTHILPFPLEPVEIERRLWTATGFFPTINSYVYFGGVDGSFVGLNRQPGRIELRLRDSHNSPRQILSVATPKHRLGLLRTDAYDPRTRPWYTKTVASGRPTWSDVYTDFTTLEPVVTLSKPVYRADRQLVGVVATDLSLTQLTNFFNSLTVSKTGIAYLVERSGAVIATSTNELPYRTDKKAIVRLMAQQSLSPLLRQSFQEVLQWQRNGDSLERPVSRSFESNQGMVQVGASLLRDKAGLEWVIIVAAPRADFISNVASVMYESLGIGLIAVALVMILGFMLLQWVLRDIGKLTRAAERVGLGLPMGELNITRGDEIGLLAMSFQNMERNLRTDKLTGALNRDALISHIEFRRRDTSRATALKFSLLFLDLDLFKPINDQYGHDTGDTVLIETAYRLKHSIRETDEVARFGGDEFVVYMDGVNDEEELDAVCKKICAVIQVPHEIRPGLTVQVGASIGWASYPADGNDLKTLLRVADTRMFQSKKLRKHGELLASPTRDLSQVR